MKKSCDGDYDRPMPMKPPPTKGGASKPPSKKK